MTLKMRVVLATLAVVTACGRGDDSAPPPGEVAEVTSALQKARACTRESAAYLPYPMEVCELPVIGPATAATFAKRGPKAFCSIKGGPWYAVLVDRESCSSATISDFHLVIYGPQVVELQWTGRLTDAPAPVNPNLFSHWREAGCTCCTGGVECDGICLPPRRMCEPPVIY